MSAAAGRQTEREELLRLLREHYPIVLDMDGARWHIADCAYYIPMHRRLRIRLGIECGNHTFKDLGPRELCNSIHMAIESAKRAQQQGNVLKAGGPVQAPTRQER